MKKLISMVAVLLFAVSAFGVFPASAEKLNGVEMNPNNFKPICDFDSVPKTYADGFKMKSFDGSVHIDGISFWDPTIKNGAGVKGNALTLHIHDVASKFACIEFDTEGKNATKDYSFATDLIFYIDTTKDKKNDGTYNERTLKIVIQETDVLPDGTLNEKKATAFNPLDGVYKYQDKNGNWVDHKTGDGSDYSSNPAGKEWIKLPAQYKGWIRIPATSLKQAPGFSDSVDSDGHFDGKEVQYVTIAFGLWDWQSGADIVLDEVGFYKDTGTPTTPTTTKNGPKNTTSVKTPAGSTVSSTGGSDLTSGSDTSTDVLSSDTDTSSDDLANISITGTGTSKTMLNPTKNVGSEPTKKLNPWVIIIPIAVVLLAGGGAAAYFFLYKKKKNPTDKI